MSQMQGSAVTPPWLRDESIEDAAPLNSPVNPTMGPASGMEIGNSDRKGKFVYWLLKVVTMSLCLLMAITAIIGIGSIDGVEASGKIFVAVYMLFFSTLLFTFEAVEIKPVEWVDHMLRRNFGFLYGALGKSLFTIFIAVLSFGLGDPQSLTFATGSSLTLFGCLQLGLYLKYPEMFEPST